MRPGISKQAVAVALGRWTASANGAGRLPPDWPNALEGAAAHASELNTVAAIRRTRRRLSTRRWLGRVIGVVVAAAVIGATGGSTDPWVTATHWIRVADASGTLSAAVPVTWGGQLKDQGWDPAAIGLPDGHQPGLLVGAHLDTWAEPQSDGPGVFAGLTSTPTAVRLPAHDRCTLQPDRRVRVNGLAGRVQRWTGCAGAAVSFSEVVLTAPDGRGLYVQIKQVDQPDRTDEVLHTVRLRHS